MLIFDYLRKRRYDVFIDIEKIDSGAFDKVILNQIGARTHFIILLTNGSLERCQNHDDWLRREIEEALRLGRNIVPIKDEEFDFNREIGYLPVEWREEFSKLNMLPWVHFFYEDVLKKLRVRFLKPPEFPVTLKPVSVDEEREVAERLAKIIQEPLPTPDETTTSVDEVVTYVPEDEPTISADFSTDEPIVEQIADDVAESEFMDVTEVGTGYIPSLQTTAQPPYIPSEITTQPPYIPSQTTTETPSQTPVPVRTTFLSSTPPRKIITPYTTSLKIMPKPFKWITIPAGKVTIEGYPSSDSYLKENTTFDVPAFQIAKYPTTNAQFEVFINHPDGYKNPVWWDFSEDAKKWRMENTKPESKRFYGDNHPRIQVIWCESVAFCLWLSAITGEKIMLPTEQQWQRAAQGDDGRIYPWGNEWDKKRCNNSVSIKNWRGKEIGESKSTTPVTQYKGIGDSPYGVVDMAGNVWEWCVTDWNTGKSDLNGTNERVLRGGSWCDGVAASFRFSLRDLFAPGYWDYGRGFRFARF